MLFPHSMSRHPVCSLVCVCKPFFFSFSLLSSQYGVDMHKKYGLVQTQCTGFIPYISCCDPAILRLIFTSKAHCYHKARHEVRRY